MSKAVVLNWQGNVRNFREWLASWRDAALWIEALR